MRGKQSSINRQAKAPAKTSGLLLKKRWRKTPYFTKACKPFAWSALIKAAALKSPVTLKVLLPFFAV
jgi:hypothetical protein